MHLNSNYSAFALFEYCIQFVNAAQIMWLWQLLTISIIATYLQMYCYTTE